MIVTAHQPNFLPGRSVLAKLRRADIVVWLDDADFTKGGFINRNQLPDGTWLTVPVRRHKAGTAINRIETADEHAWQSKIAKTLRERYRRTEHYDDRIASLIDGYPGGGLLVDLTIPLLDLIREHLGRYAPVPALAGAGQWAPPAMRPLTSVLASQLHAPRDLPPSERLAALTLEAGGVDATYLSGPSGKGYLDPAPFVEAGVGLGFERAPVGPNPCGLDPMWKVGSVG